MKQQDYFEQPIKKNKEECQLEDFAFFKTPSKEILKEQEKLNKILSKLSDTEKKQLHSVFSWLQEEQTKTIEHNFGKDEEE